MAYESLTMAFGWVQTALLFIAVYFAVFTLKHLFRKKTRKEMMLVKKPVFVSLTAGVTALAIAFLIQNIYGLFSIQKSPSAADIFLVIAYLCLAVGFGYFWYRSARLHQLHIRDPIFIIGVVCGVFIWLYYLFAISIIPKSAAQPALNSFLNYFYPIIVSMIFIFTLIVHPRLRAGVIRTPLWYLSTAAFTYFLGHMMLTYSLGNTTLEFMPVIYHVLFFISACYFALGFFAAKRKYS